MGTVPTLGMRPRRVPSLSRASRLLSCPRRFYRALENGSQWFELSERRFARSLLSGR